MFRFQHAPYFWFLLLVPVIILCYLYFLAWRKRNIKKLGTPPFIQALIQGKISGRLTTKVILTSLSIACLVAALANLQAGGHAEQVERKGLDVIFALDVSNSMLARDVSPDRMTKAKELIFRTLEQLRNDRTGLVVFAGNAYIQVPLTVDYGAMKMLLEAVNPGMVPTQGTNFTDAISLASQSFSKEDKQNKVVILISDGEDHSESAIKTAKTVADEGVLIYTVGVGSPGGSTIYDPSTGGPKVDKDGHVVITKLNEKELQRIAYATGGQYQLLQSASGVANQIAQSVQQLGKKNLGTVVYTNYKSYFQYFLGAALVLFLMAWLLPEARKGAVATAVSKNNPILWIGLLTAGLCLSQPAFAQQQPSRPPLSFKKEINKGNQEFAKRQYSSAQKTYQEALQQSPHSFEGNFNLGDALYASGKYEDARKYLHNSLKNALSPKDKAETYHNIGNSLLQQRKWQEAADAFKQSLLLNPGDQNTKYNLAYAQEMMRRQQQQQKKNKNNKDSKKNKNQQDKDKQDQQQNKDKDKDRQKKDEDKQPSDKDDNRQKQPPQAQQHPSRLTKQQADNILNALNQEEKDLHKRKKEETGTPVHPEKDW